MELARGSITDRPWGLTLSALDRRQFTGQLTLTAADGRTFVLAFDRGAVVGAVSPVATDAIARIALTSHLLAASQVPALARRLAADPRDEVDVLVELAHLTAEQEVVLRERAILQRAARTFAVERGDFVLSERIDIACSPCAIDVRAIVYLGARMNLSEQRLVDDLRWMGSRFVVRAEAQDELLRFGFTGEEHTILEAVRRGTSVYELEALHRELDRRTVLAVLLALAACGTARALPATGTTLPPPVRVETLTTDSGAHRIIRTPTPLVVKVPADAVRPAPVPAPSRTYTPTPNEWMTIGTPTDLVGRTLTPVNVPPPRTRTPLPPLDLDKPPELQTVEPPAADPVAAAALAFKRGVAAMRSEQVDRAIAELAEATRLDPEQQEYVAMFAWAKFCGAADKAKIAEDTRRTLAKAIAHSKTEVAARFLLGRVERILGRDREALAQFQKVVELAPRHAEAAAEIRVIELRAQTAPKLGSRLFGRKP